MEMASLYKVLTSNPGYESTLAAQKNDPEALDAHEIDNSLGWCDTLFLKKRCVHGVKRRRNLAVPLQNRKRDLERNYIAIGKLLEEASQAIESSRCAEHLEYIEPTPCTEVYANYSTLLQAVRGLLVFSKKMAPDKRISVWAEPYGISMICIGIGHAGPGLTSHDQQRLFSSAEPNDKSWKAGPIRARQIARWHGGDLWVRNHRSFGTTFYLWLPAQLAEAA